MMNLRVQFADGTVKEIAKDSSEALSVLRHSTAHLLAYAVQNLFKDVHLATGPATQEGFYYDFACPAGFTPEDLLRLEEEMRRLVKLAEPFRLEVWSREQALEFFKARGESYKCAIIEGLPATESITVYHTGNWTDLCRGPHVAATADLGAFKLTHVAGAYWRGDERNPMLARIYGTAFADEATLKAHLAAIEEAKKRDHRKLGKELGLFTFYPEAPAMPFFQPDGATIYNLLVDFVRGYYRDFGFQEVITPQLVDLELYKRSGHYAHYQENMFFCQVDEREFGLKPMNCPCHALMFAGGSHSYRDLPLRYADFGRLHRYERSGVTAGLTRVRSFAQDDAHIFCSEEQIGQEITRQIRMLEDIYSHFGFTMEIALSTRPAQSIGREPELSASEVAEWDALWQRAEANLAAALDQAQLVYQLSPGDGAFYGPKVDCKIKDALGRAHQLGTIQLDFSMPRRFDLQYVQADNQRARPVMIHRAMLGSLERFIGILLEHLAGDLPLWLAPKQARILTVNDALLAYGREVASGLAAAGLRVEVDTRNEKLGFKIRQAELAKIPVVLVLGQREAEGRSAAVRWRKKGDLGQKSLDQVRDLMLEAAKVPRASAALKEQFACPWHEL